MVEFHIEKDDLQCGGNDRKVGKVLDSQGHVVVLNDVQVLL